MSNVSSHHYSQFFSTHTASGRRVLIDLASIESFTESVKAAKANGLTGNNLFEALLSHYNIDPTLLPTFYATLLEDPHFALSDIQAMPRVFPVDLLPTFLAKTGMSANDVVTLIVKGIEFYYDDYQPSLQLLSKAIELGADFPLDFPASTFAEFIEMAGISATKAATLVIQHFDLNHDRQHYSQLQCFKIALELGAAPKDVFAELPHLAFPVAKAIVQQEIYGHQQAPKILLKALEYGVTLPDALAGLGFESITDITKPLLSTTYSGSRESIQQHFDLILSMLDLGADVDMILESWPLSSYARELGIPLFEQLLVRQIPIEKLVTTVVDIKNYAIFQWLLEKAGVDISVYTNKEGTLLDALASEAASLPHFELALTYGAQPSDLSALYYLVRLYQSASIDEAARFIALFPGHYHAETAYQEARNRGASHLDIQALQCIHQVAAEWLHVLQGNSTTFNLLELNILDPNALPLPIEMYTQQSATTNPYGLSPLHLAILAGKYTLAQTMLTAGFDPWQEDSHHISPFQLLLKRAELEIEVSEGESTPEALIKDIFRQIDDKQFAALENSVATSLGGESPLDIMFESEELSHLFLGRTNDPLYMLLKNVEEDDLPQLEAGKVHIAISHDANRWSTGVWAMARVTMHEQPDVQFHLVSQQLIDLYGPTLLEQFDGIINPGGADGYPRDVEKFTNKECKHELSIEQLYQTVATHTEMLNLPYLGMCAGAQHLALYHGSTLGPLSSSGAARIDFIPGTLPYFKTLTGTQQQALLQSCDMPEISYLADTAHHYGAYPNHMGPELELGAMLDGRIAMAYSHQNGLFAATQFHPEHCAGVSSENCVQQNAWLDSFVALARMHYEHVHGEGIAPLDYYAGVQARLAQCLSAPTSLAGDFYPLELAMPTFECQATAW
jgi:anthranilate/para-aminobenzoate synthase component II